MIIIGRKGTAGKVWLSKNPFYPSDTIYYLNWKKNIDIDFLFNYMTLNPLSGEHAKTTRPSLQKPQLENMFSPLPEQHQIAETLSAIDDKINAEQTKKTSLNTFFKTLLSMLMTGKIREKGLEIPV